MGGRRYFVVVVYDVHVSRIPRVRAFLSKYLLWTQNSVFEGWLSKDALQEVREGLESIINKSYDRVRIYVRLKGNMDVVSLGAEKGAQTVI